MLPRLSRRGTATSWRSTLLAVCIAQAVAIVGFDFTLPFIPLYLQHDLGVRGLGQTALWAGLIGFGPAIPATIFGPVWGSVADRFGYRFMLLRAMICASILLTLMGLAPSPGILLVLRMIQGSLTGTVFAAQALVAATVPEKETGRSMGLLQMSVSLGATIGPVGGGAVAQYLGFRAPFAGAGILLALGTIVVYFFVHEPERRVPTEQQPAAKPSFFTVLRIPIFLAALILTLVTQLCVTALFPIIPLFVQELLHGAANVAADTGWVMALAGIASAAGAYVAGRLQRTLGLRPLLIAALALSALLLLPQAFVGSYTAFLLLRGIASFAFGGLFSLVGVWAAISSPADAKGTAFGLMGAASSMGFGAGPLLGGALAAAIGIRPVFVLSALLLAGVPMLFGLAMAATSARRRLAAAPRAT
jgi:DHA1 family multidrug resistance protein-like MFS transporter